MPRSRQRHVTSDGNSPWYAAAGNRATSTVTSSTMTGVEGEEEQRKETSAREAASQQKKEELAKKRAEKAAKTKNTKRRARKSVSGEANRLSGYKTFFHR